MEGEGLFVSIGMGTQAQGMGIGAAEGFRRAFCEGLSGFFCVYEVFWKFFKDFPAPIKRSD